jgi:hypothetical protein
MQALYQAKHFKLIGVVLELKNPLSLLKFRERERESE